MNKLQVIDLFDVVKLEEDKHREAKIMYYVEKKGEKR